MKRRHGAAILLACAAAAFAAKAGPAPNLQQPAWAYAIGPAVPPFVEDGKVYRLPGSDRALTVTQIRGGPDGPADWYPGDHPAMPPVVAKGAPDRGVRPCALCHYPNGKGRPENAGLAGLPCDYIVGQMHDWRAGLRRSAEPLKGNMATMQTIARGMTEDEIAASAAYFSSMSWTPWIKVVESRTAPKVRSSVGMYIPLVGVEAGSEPIAGRIVETPVKPQRTELMRDPRSGFVAYAPVGAVARGKAIVATGKHGESLACAACHGADLNGMGAVPGIAARSPSYIARQLNDFRQGARAGALGAAMTPVVANLTTADITDIAAYLASRPAAAR